MATKKIIAICQSGGEFETNKDGSLSYNGGEAFALELDQQMQLSDFKQELAEIFHCSVDGMLIKYLLPGNRKTLITISIDKDLKRMVGFFKDSDQVDVFVMTVEGVAQNVSYMPASRLSNTSMLEAVVPQAVPVDAMNTDDKIFTDTNIETSPTDAHVNINGEKHRRAAMQWENAITGVDQTFCSITEFREALHKYSIAHGFAFKYMKNDSHRASVKCKSEGCPWQIYASKLASTQLICIKKMNTTHTCEGAAVKSGFRATRVAVTSIIKEKLKVSPYYAPRDIASDIKREYGIELNYTQAWRAKEIAREQLRGSYKEAYKQLPLLCEKILETNPGSIATFATKEDSSFHRLFISFKASISGFQQGCRPLLFLDSTPLCSKYQGTLLAATTADGDDGVFPVAFAVVDADTDDNWHWFLLELKSAVSTSRPITFVADTEKGLRESLREIFDKSQHGYCLRYLAEKLNEDFRRQFSHEARRLMLQDLYTAAYAHKLEAFEHCTENIKAISPEAYSWVIKSEPDHWANAFFLGSRYNHMESNFGELFYNWVAEANELPIPQLVDVLRGKMMELIYTRRVDSNQWGTRLTPSVEQKLRNETSKSCSLQVLLSHDSTYEVRGESVDLVDIDHWDCSCKGWQLTGFPCCHAIAVFEFIGRSPYDYCSQYFTSDSYRVTYAESIYPVSHVENLAKNELTETAVTVTPPTKCPLFRPKMKLAGLPEKVKRHMQCSKCKGIGHNKKSCKIEMQ